MSPSEVHSAIKRALAAKLALQDETHIRPNTRNLEEFLLHGIQYVFVPEKGASCRGMPTAHAASPMNAQIQSGQELPPVWPDAERTLRGESFSPLYSSAVAASKRDTKLYELMALVDAIRGGRASERGVAKMELKKALDDYGQSAEY